MNANFFPSLWPLDKAPREISNCTKCELCNQRSEVIWGEGNPKASIIIILDNPGLRKNKNGEEFVCGTRDTLQRAAFNVGFRMEDLYITYILKCRPIRKYEKEIARDICFNHLLIQIKSQNPKIAFCMGNTALKWFSSNMEAEVKNIRGKWHIMQGIPTLATYHPLAVRRRPNLERVFMQDWTMLFNKFNCEKCFSQ